MLPLPFKCGGGNNKVNIWKAMGFLTLLIQVSTACWIGRKSAI